MQPDLKDTEACLQTAASLLAAQIPDQRRMNPCGSRRFPSPEALEEVTGIIRQLVFPDFFDHHRGSEAMRGHHAGMGVERLYWLLLRQVGDAMRYGRDCRETDMERQAHEAVVRFINLLPGIKQTLYTDVQAVYDNDPAVDNYAEVVLCYPVVKAMVYYRTAHALLGLGVPLLPRILTESAHSSTGIDIHPGATIGRYFAIDHGTGVVIGETCIIGEHVTIYQGVTLGAKNFVYDVHGHPRNLPRHPVLEDRVTVYSNSSILGRITVGHDSIIGGNVWLTESVPPGSRVVQGGVR